MPGQGAPESLLAFCEQLALDAAGGSDWEHEPNPEIFAAGMVKAGQTAGCHFSSEDVAALLAARRRAWWERAVG